MSSLWPISFLASALCPHGFSVVKYCRGAIPTPRKSSWPESSPPVYVWRFSRNLISSRFFTDHRKPSGRCQSGLSPSSVNSGRTLTFCILGESWESWRRPRKKLPHFLSQGLRSKEETTSLSTHISWGKVLRKHRQWYQWYSLQLAALVAVPEWNHGWSAQGEPWVGAGGAWTGSCRQEASPKRLNVTGHGEEDWSWWPRGGTQVSGGLARGPWAVPTQAQGCKLCGPQAVPGSPVRAAY